MSTEIKTTSQLYVRIEGKHYNLDIIVPGHHFEVRETGIFEGYQVARGADGVVRCTCLGYKFGRRREQGRRVCRHVLALEEVNLLQPSELRPE